MNKRSRKKQMKVVRRIFSRDGTNGTTRVKLAAMFSSVHEENGNQLKSSIFKNADPSNLVRSLLEGNKDHLLSQARSELIKQEH